MGESLSEKYRKCRAKRILVNLKVNAFAYAMEVCGGILILFFATIPYANYLYTFIIIWYGNVIPSCYLANSEDIKLSVMEDGWWNGLSKLYRKKSLKERSSSSNKRNLDKKADRKEVKDVKANGERSDQYNESSQSGDAKSGAVIKATMIQDDPVKNKGPRTRQNRKNKTSKISQGLITNDLEKMNDISLSELGKRIVASTENTSTSTLAVDRDVDRTKMASTVFYLKPKSCSAPTFSTQDYDSPMILPNEVDYT